MLDGRKLTAKVVSKGTTQLKFFLSKPASLDAFYLRDMSGFEVFPVLTNSED
jgi:hypothetical protein